MATRPARRLQIVVMSMHRTLLSDPIRGCTTRAPVWSTGTPKRTTSEPVHATGASLRGTAVQVGTLVHHYTPRTHRYAPVAHQ
eukprot:gene10353-biopygen1352